MWQLALIVAALCLATPAQAARSDQRAVWLVVRTEALGHAPVTERYERRNMPKCLYSLELGLSWFLKGRARLVARTPYTAILETRNARITYYCDEERLP